MDVYMTGLFLFVQHKPDIRILLTVLKIILKNLAQIFLGNCIGRIMDSKMAFGEQLLFSIQGIAPFYRLICQARSNARGII